MRRSVLALAALVLLLCAGAARADEAARPYENRLLDHLAGRWVLRGRIAGQATTHDVTAEWVLGHQYLRVREVSREQDVRGRPQYEAIVFLGTDPAGDGVACLWLDNTGPGGLNGQSIGHAPAAAGDTLAFRFRSPDGGAFHTTFAYRAASDSWSWFMDVEAEGGLQPFARTTLTRAGATPRR
jgi:hypothetical protein